MNDIFVITIDAPVNGSMKSSVKQAFLDEMTDIINSNGASETKLMDFHYADRRSADYLQSLIVTLSTVAPILSMSASLLSISRTMWQMNKKVKIMVKRNDGAFIEITEGMTEDDVINALNIGRSNDETKDKD